MPTMKQKKAIVNLVENGGNISKAMRDAGYSKNTASTPQKLTESEGGKELLNPVVLAMEKERKAILQRLPKVRNLAKYSELTHGVDVLTKNIQLLNGGKTSNEGVTISWS